MTQQKRRLGLAVPVSLYGKLVALAEYQGKTINSMCLDIFWRYFEEKQNAISPKEGERTSCAHT